MSYNEKSIWISLISTVIIFGIYFFKAFMIINDPTTADSVLILYFIYAVALAILVQISTQIFFALTDKASVEAGMDERDRSIDLKTTRSAYYVLVVGIWAAVGSQALESNTTLLINLLMLAFVAAELVTYISKLVIYRRGY